MADFSNNELKNLIQERLSETGGEEKAIIGRPDGQIRSLEPNASVNDIYVTLMNGQIITVYNEKVPRIPFRKIILGVEPGSPNRLQAIRLDDVYKRRPFPNLPNHKDSHSAWGYDPIEVLKEQLMELLPRAVDGFNIRIYPGWFFCNGYFHALQLNDLDLSTEAVASGAEWVNVETDEAGTITYQHSANYGSRELLIPENIPITDLDKKLLCSVKMYAGQVRIIQNKTRTDIFDPRLSGIASIYGRPDLVGKALEPVTAVTKKEMDSFFINGALAVIPDVTNSFVVQRYMKLHSILIHCKDKGSADTTIVDAHLNGTTIFTDQDKRPMLDWDAAEDFAISETPDVIEIAPGDVLTFDIDAIGTDASGLTITPYERIIEMVTVEDDIATAQVEMT